jgi:4-hydroxy-2-oxoheptanedioate aldolase
MKDEKNKEGISRRDAAKMMMAGSAAGLFGLNSGILSGAPGEGNQESAQITLLNKFKAKLKAGKPVYGPFIETIDPAFIEVSGYSGFDFVIIDMEHGPAGLSQVQNLISAAVLTNVIPIVRTSNATDTAIHQPLDLGALGVQIPQVSTSQMVKDCVKSARFFPEGERGLCRFVRAAEYSALPRDEYFKKANEGLVIIQLEGKEVLDDLDNILKVEGVDIFFIGPYDLSQSLGVPGQVTHPKVIETINGIVKRALSLGVVVGSFADTLQAAAMWKKAGIQYISYSHDVGIYTDACSRLLKDLNAQ